MIVTLVTLALCIILLNVWFCAGGVDLQDFGPIPRRVQQGTQSVAASATRSKEIGRITALESNRITRLVVVRIIYGRNVRLRINHSLYRLRIMSAR